MFEFNDGLNSPSVNPAPESAGSSSHDVDYALSARQALENNNRVLAMHLYLTAYEESTMEESGVTEDAVEALRQAWTLACDLGERSIAEYIYEKIEPYLTDEEVELYARRLQNLALDKLSEFGISRTDLEDITDMISDELEAAVQMGNVTPMVSAVHVDPALMSRSQDKDIAEALMDSVLPDGILPEGVIAIDDPELAERIAEVADALEAAEAAQDIKAAHAQSAEGDSVGTDADNETKGTADDKPFDISKIVVIPEDKELEEITASLHETIAEVAKQAAEHKKANHKGSGHKTVAAQESVAKNPVNPPITYKDLVGFDRVIEEALTYGIGLDRDPDMRDLLELLREQHGLDKLSAFGSLVFRTSSREDASFFMAATVGELDLPAMRVQMQPGPQGIPILAVSVSADRQPRIQQNRMTLDAPSVLVLEDIDLWGNILLTAGVADGEESPHSQQASAMRAARDALTVIHAAVANPEVYVLASLSDESEDAAYLYDLLEPMNVIDIYLPTAPERREIWDKIVQDHRSLRHLDFDELTKLSKNVSRSDIISAAREAIEEAYRESLRERKFVAVSKENMYGHLANYQSLDSQEYEALENAIVDSFTESLDGDLDELFNDGENHDN